MEAVNGQLQTKYQKIATEYSKVRKLAKLFDVDIVV